MPIANYGKKSLYSNTPIRAWYLGIWPGKEVPQSESDQIYTIPNEYNLRPDLAAFNLYGDEKYWYIFALRNKDLIKDPIFDFKAGKVIYILDADTVRSI